jgi:anti-sigma B factor antagonist
MQPHDVTIAVTAEDDEAVVRVRGEVGLTAGPVLWERLSTLIAGGLRRVVVDVEDASFVDSTGLSVIAMAARALQAQDGELFLRCA